MDLRELREIREGRESLESPVILVAMEHRETVVPLVILREAF